MLHGLGMLSFGPMCFVVNNRRIGLNCEGVSIMTCHHALNDPRVASTTSVGFFNNTKVIKLRPDILWLTSTNKDNGLDYTVIGLSSEDQRGIYEAGLGHYDIIHDNSNLTVHSKCYLAHKPYSSPALLYSTCDVASIEGDFIRYVYLDHPSSGGSSGAPLFFSRDKIEFKVMGLHKAYGKSVSILSIIADIKRTVQNHAGSLTG